MANGHLIHVQTLAEDGKLIIWNLELGQRLQEIDYIHCGPVVSTIWLPSYQQTKEAFAVGYGDGTIYVYSRPNLCVRFGLSCINQFTNPVYSPNMSLYPPPMHTKVR